MGDCCRAGRVAAPDPCPWHAANPDPRVKHGDGPHPNITAVTELAESVHARLDALGVPREIAPCHDLAATTFCQECAPPGSYREPREMTLLGRIDAVLDKLGVQEGQEWTWFGEKWT